MHWIHLTHEDQVQKIIVRSQEKPQVIFKYSSNCNLSDVVFKRLQKNCCPGDMDFHFLDLISFRNISDKIADTFSVVHKSPQILLIINGKCIFDESHSEISLDEIIEHAAVAA